MRIPTKEHKVEMGRTLFHGINQMDTTTHIGHGLTTNHIRPVVIDFHRSTTLAVITKGTSHTKVITETTILHTETIIMMDLIISTTQTIKDESAGTLALKTQLKTELPTPKGKITITQERYHHPMRTLVDK